MGFRSNFITNLYLSSDIYNKSILPDWFIEKYQGLIRTTGMLASNAEKKFYDDEFQIDIQKAYNWKNSYPEKIVMILFHECNGITRVEITKDSIRYSEPTTWKETDGVTHSYCYGCSDINKIKKQ